MGWVYYLIGVGPTLLVVPCLTASFDLTPVPLVFTAACGLLPPVCFVCGTGLARLSPWAKTPACLLLVVGMVVVPPVGTLIGAYILDLLITEKGRVVFSTKYREVVRQTPHIRCNITVVIVLVTTLVALSLVSALLLLLGFVMTRTTGG